MSIGSSFSELDGRVSYGRVKPLGPKLGELLGDHRWRDGFLKNFRAQRSDLFMLGRVASAGNNQHGRVLDRRIIGHLPQQFESVHLRHRQVCNDQVDIGAAKTFERLRAIVQFNEFRLFGTGNFKATADEHPSQCRIVCDYDASHEIPFYVSYDMKVDMF